MSDLETKEKIMNAAMVLFSEYGYDGTSVRDIAKEADVNVASVNYYFSSNENLFVEILKSAYLHCSEEMKSYLEKNKGDLENTLVDLLRYFLENTHDLRSHFKMMLSSQHSHHLISEGTQDGSYGPPGGMILAEVLRKECPETSDEDIHWALKTLFSQVMHLAVIHSICARKNHNIPFSSQEDMEKSVRRVTRLVLLELKSLK